MSKLYAPKINNIAPAFAGNKIIIPYYPSAYNNVRDWNRLQLSIKDPLLQDTTIITIYSNIFDGAQVEFTLSAEDINKLIQGNKYKGYLACCQMDGAEIENQGQYSDAFVIKYLGATAPSIIEGELNSNFMFNCVYSPPSDLTEKLYSIQYILKDKNAQTVETSEEILLNYSNIFIDNAENKINLSYQFNPRFDAYLPHNYDISNIQQKYEDIGTWANNPIQPIYIENTLLLDYYPCVNALQDFYAGHGRDFILGDNGLPLNESGTRPDYLGLPPIETYSVYVQFTTLNQYSSIAGPWTLAPVWYIDTSGDYNISAQSIPDLAINNVVFNRSTSLTSDSGENFYCLRLNTFNNAVRKIASQKLRLIDLTTDVYTNNITTNTNNNGYGMLDFDLEQGVNYNYILCYTKNAKSHYVITQNIMNNFEDVFICDSTHLLCLKFNPKITNYKTTRQEAKVETIGSPYPLMFRNAHIGYQEFTINTLLSYFMDQDCFFINGMTDPKYAHVKRAMLDGFSPMFLSVSRANDGLFTKKYDFSPSAQLTGENKLIEREFKEAVLDWLGNGEIKLFKSPVENNHLVRLINISTTPEDKLGRMLHSVSAQAIEMEEYNNENIEKRNMLYYKNS